MNCQSWRRYKGLRKPKCRSGKGCPKCRAIYAERKRRAKDC